MANVFLRHGSIGDLPFPHAARARLAQPDDVERLAAQFANDGTNFGGPDFEADNYGGRIKHFSFCCEGCGAIAEARAAARWPPKTGRECCCSPPNPDSRSLCWSCELFRRSPAIAVF